MIIAIGYRGHLSVVAELIKHNANIYAKSKDGITALKLARIRSSFAYSDQELSSKCESIYNLLKARVRKLESETI